MGPKARGTGWGARLFGCRLLCASALLSMGCGDDGGEDGGGGGSGVEGTKQLLQLTPAEKDTLCAWAAPQQPARACPDGATIEAQTPAKCVQEMNGLSEGCTATVADSEKCAKVDACDTAAALEQCLPLLACSTLGLAGASQ